MKKPTLKPPAVTSNAAPAAITSIQISIGGLQGSLTVEQATALRDELVRLLGPQSLSQIEFQKLKEDLDRKIDQIPGPSPYLPYIPQRQSDPVNPLPNWNYPGPPIVYCGVDGGGTSIAGFEAVSGGYVK